MKKTVVALLIGISGCVPCEIPWDPPFVPPTPTATAVPTVGPTRTPTPPVGSGKQVCEGPQKAPDGPGGFLWKDGDHTGALVLLLPGKFKEASSVEVTRKNGNKEKLRFTGYGNPDSDGERQHWRGTQPVAKYLGVVDIKTGSKSCQYKFKNSSRVD